MIYADIFEGMYIGGVEPVHITADSPIDYSQWEDGKPWHTRRDSVMAESKTPKADKAAKEGKAKAQQAAKDKITASQLAIEKILNEQKDKK